MAVVDVDVHFGLVVDPKTTRALRDLADKLDDISQTTLASRWDRSKLEEQANLWKGALPVIRNIMDEMEEFEQEPSVQNTRMQHWLREWRARLEQVCP